MTISLPIPGGDTHTWGAKLNAWLNVRSAELANMRAGRLNALDFPGIDPTGTTDSSAGLAAMATAAGNNQVQGTSGIICDIPPGEYLLNDTVEFVRFAGSFRGSGRGNSPEYGIPGHATVFRWNGAAGEPMFRLRDSQLVEMSHFRMEGKEGSLPSYGIECVATTGEGAGTNSYFSFHDLYIGRYPWTTQGIHKGDVTSGIGYTGDNVNNDEFQIERIVFANAASHGIYLPNTQSLGGSINDVYFLSCGTGIATNSGVQGSNWNFWDSGTDIDVGSTANVIVQNVYSEGTRRFAALGPEAYLSIYGGAAQLDQVIANGEVMIAASPSGTQRLTLKDLKCTLMTDATKARIEIGGTSGSGHVGRFLVKVEGCEGLQPAQLVFGSGASMWAHVPMSKGVVEWQSTHGDNIYQFRNELGESGAGRRTTLDYAAWDAPVTD